MLTDFEALSPLDGRYQNRVAPLAKFFSEKAFFAFRIEVECLYLCQLSEAGVIRKFTRSELTNLAKLPQLGAEEMTRLKVIENTTRHDVKAIEYFIREKLAPTSLHDVAHYVHAGLTSEDVNNVAYRLMISRGIQTELLPVVKQVIEALVQGGEKYADLPMLARTHGQPAIPTTFGKELVVFADRLAKKLLTLSNYSLSAKLNGAVGGYHGLMILKPDLDWLHFSDRFINRLGLTWNMVTTQVNPADDLAEVAAHFHQLNCILIDLNQDIWRYISDDWLVQKGKGTTVGSSTMPQKINPIEFENSEGNLVMANALFEVFLRKLPVSRLQRDLSDSTVMRNWGSSFGYCLLAYQSWLQGWAHLQPNVPAMTEALESNYAILLEALQIFGRTTGDTLAYEKAMKLGKGKRLTVKDWRALTHDYPAQIRDLTPSTYLGLSSKITLQTCHKITKQLKHINRKGQYESS